MQYFATLVLLGLCLDIVNKYANDVAIYQKDWAFGKMILAELNILGVFLVTGKVVQIIPQALAGLFGGGSSSGYDAGGIAGRVVGGIAGAAALGAGAGTLMRGIGKGLSNIAKKSVSSGGNVAAAKAAEAASSAGKIVAKAADNSGISAAAKTALSQSFGSNSQSYTFGGKPFQF